MKKMKQMGALALAAMTALSTVNMPVYAAESTLANGTYEVETHFMKASKISEASMCDSLFYSTATAVVDGDMTDLTFYVINPIPTFATAGQPITDLYVTYEDEKYAATIDAENQVTKSFDVNFMGAITGDYPCDVITMSVPTEAVASNSEGSLAVTAYVNAVMASYQDFFMVMDLENANFTPAESDENEDTSSEDADKDEAEATQTTVTAYKTGTETASSMAGYIYQYPSIEKVNDGYKVTLYMTAGEIGYLVYDGEEISLTENAKTIEGVSYDSVAFTMASLEERVNVSAYVNQMAAIMPAYAVQAFDLYFTYADVADKSEEQNMELTAQVDAEEATYYVTIPASLSLGSLSRTEDTEVEYEVAIEAEDMTDLGYVQISAPDAGSLTSDSNSIAFANSFGTKSYTASATEKAKITVLAENVSKVGSYTGTTTFAIDFFAAE